MIDERESAERDALRRAGERIRRARVEAGLSEDELGESVGISGMTVHLYETGQADPRENLAGIAAAAGLPLSWFTEDDVGQPVPAAEVEPPVVETEPPLVEQAEAQPPAVEEALIEEPEPPGVDEEPDRLEKRAAELDQRSAQLDQRTAELDERTAELAEREAGLVAEQQRLDALAAVLTAREAAIEARAAAEPEPVCAEAEPEVKSEPEPLATWHPPGEPVSVRPHDVSGKSMIVDTADGGHVRVTASRRDDSEGHFYLSEYEVMSADTWRGKQIFVWKDVRTYRTCEGHTVEECLEAALAEIAGGPRPPEPEAPEPELLPEPPEERVIHVRKPRRGLLGFLRR